MSWRARNQKQAKDKQTIYNSREWRELREQKLRANPLCEVCQQKGIVTAAHQVHHIHPIEDSHSVQEMRKWAFMYGTRQKTVGYIESAKNGGVTTMISAGECHTPGRPKDPVGTKALAIERAKQRQDRWADGLISRFTASKGEGEGHE